MTRVKDTSPLAGVMASSSTSPKTLTTWTRTPATPTGVLGVGAGLPGVASATVPSRMSTVISTLICSATDVVVSALAGSAVPITAVGVAVGLDVLASCTVVVGDSVVLGVTVVVVRNANVSV